MQFTWTNRYVPQGQLTPDKHNRWALDCYIHVKPKVLNLAWITHEYYPVKIATITMRETQNNRENVVLSFEYCAVIPSVGNAPTLGLSNPLYLYDNDIERLKQRVEKEFLLMREIFLNVKE